MKVWVNRVTGALWSEPEKALEAHRKKKSYDTDEYWVLPEKDGVVVVMTRESYSDASWKIMMQLHLTEVGGS